jgi:hypothetical protein
MDAGTLVIKPARIRQAEKRARRSGKFQSKRNQSNQPPSGEEEPVASTSAIGAPGQMISEKTPKWLLKTPTGYLNKPGVYQDECLFASLVLARMFGEIHRAKDKVKMKNRGGKMRMNTMIKELTKVLSKEQYSLLRYSMRQQDPMSEKVGKRLDHGIQELVDLLNQDLDDEEKMGRNQQQLHDICNTIVLEETWKDFQIIFFSEETPPSRVAMYPEVWNPALQPIFLYLSKTEMDFMHVDVIKDLEAFTNKGFACLA